MNKTTIKTSKHNTNRPIENKVRTPKEWQFTAQQLKNISCSCIEEFYLNMDIPKNTFYDAVNKYSFMKEAHEYALERLGVNKQKLCEEKNLSMNSVTANQLHHYLDRWKKDLEYKAKLKTQEDNNNEPKHIILGCLKDCCIKKEVHE